MNNFLRDWNQAKITLEELKERANDEELNILIDKVKERGDFEANKIFSKLEKEIRRKHKAEFEDEYFL